MKAQELSPVIGSSEQRSGISRRRFLSGLGLAAGVAITPKAIEVVADYLDRTDDIADYQRNSDERESTKYDKEARETIAKALEHNQAKHVKEVRTDSGIQINVFQAQTGWNDKIPLGVDEHAMNATIQFLIGNMDEVNAANGNPVKPQLITDFQQRARTGWLTDIQITAIMSATTGFHTAEGVLRNGGTTDNTYPHNGHDPRKVRLPLVSFSPDIYRPGVEVLTPKPSEGRFPKDDTSSMATFTPNAAQTLTAYFAHEVSHALLDAVGSYDINKLGSHDANHEPGDYEHKSFVLPLNWYHNAALNGSIADQPQLAPSFVVPDLTPPQG